MDDLKYFHNDEPICPHCDHEMSDAWELGSDSGDVDCGSCEKPFFYERNISVTYSTAPIAKEKAD